MVTKKDCSIITDSQCKSKNNDIIYNMNNRGIIRTLTEVFGCITLHILSIAAKKLYRVLMVAGVLSLTDVNEEASEPEQRRNQV